MKLELKPITTNWGPRGSREIWIDGAHWATAEAEGHGCHGISLSIKYPDGSPVMRRYQSSTRKGQMNETALDVRSTGSRHYRDERVTALQHLPAVVALAISDGWIESPAVRAAREAEAEAREEATRKRNRTRAEAHRRNLRALYANANEAERETLKYVWRAAYLSVEGQEIDAIA